MTGISESKESTTRYKILKSFVSGGIAGMCSKTLVAPIERVKYLFIVLSFLARRPTGRSAINHISAMWSTSSKPTGS